ncbi:hypothetical protein KJ365_13955 [Glaciecola sp. XM2]|uniref:hypothetical protein n=1 Tax=Glaciecola sp. XM2 TaxID=1914931 RepID=UPI001BDE9927|nr:hypothetical protein [Glaciecola sp. XM2]MBT1451993.1 hypothetical protein [Glaciecola sp. XM2]
MKYVSLVIMVLLITACQKGPQPMSISAATISNVSATESLDSNRYQHLINLSFDYEIKSDNEQSDANRYFCTVQFVHKEDGKSFTNRSILNEDGTPFCKLLPGQGNMSILWPGVLDHASENEVNLRNLHLPVQYFVAIHQYTSKPASIIIARSEVLSSKITRVP